MIMMIGGPEIGFDGFDVNLGDVGSVVFSGLPILREINSKG